MESKVLCHKKMIVIMKWVQAFLKKWWVESDLRRQTSRSHYGSKVPAVIATVFKYRNKIGKIVVKAVPYSVAAIYQLLLHMVFTSRN
jgi:hypothetical protein